MRLTRHQLRRIIQESVTLDIEKGDVILTGKFKNKRTVVKDFGTDDLGQPTINGMKLLKFRIEKLMPQDKWSKKSQEEADLEEGKTMKITKQQLRRIIKEQQLPMDARDIASRDVDRSAIRAVRSKLEHSLEILEDMGYDEAADHVIQALESL